MVQYLHFRILEISHWPSLSPLKLPNVRVSAASSKPSTCSEHQTQGLAIMFTGDIVKLKVSWNAVIEWIYQLVWLIVSKKSHVQICSTCKCLWILTKLFSFYPQRTCIQHVTTDSQPVTKYECGKAKYRPSMTIHNTTINGKMVLVRQSLLWCLYILVVRPLFLLTAPHGNHP